jgi:hypothetical protein
MNIDIELNACRETHNVVGLASILLFGDTSQLLSSLISTNRGNDSRKEECPRALLGKNSEMIAASHTLQTRPCRCMNEYVRNKKRRQSVAHR